MKCRGLPGYDATWEALKRHGADDLVAGFLAAVAMDQVLLMREIIQGVR